MVVYDDEQLVDFYQIYEGKAPRKLLWYRAWQSN